MRLNLSNVDQGVYTELDLTLARHPSETAERLVARIIAYSLCYQEGVEFTRGICEGDTPDIWLQQPGEKMDQWIEVGEPAPERMESACKKAKQVKLFLYGKKIWRWKQAHLPRLKGLTNLTIYPLPEELIGSLSTELERTNTWVVTLSDGELYLDSGRGNYQTSIVPLVTTEQEPGG